MSKSAQSSCVSLAAIAIMALSFPPARAQTVEPQAAAEPEPQDEVVVTGSRIRRDPLAQDAPVVQIEQADIARTGLNSINDVLQRLPSSGGGLNSRFNNSGNLGNPPDGGGVRLISASVVRVR